MSRGILTEIATAMGFKDEVEMFRLVSEVDMSSPEKCAAFEKWRHEDGTKAGLLALSGSREIVPGGNLVPTGDTNV